MIGCTSALAQYPRQLTTAASGFINFSGLQKFFDALERDTRPNGIENLVRRRILAPDREIPNFDRLCAIAEFILLIPVSEIVIFTSKQDRAFYAVEMQYGRDKSSSAAGFRPAMMKCIAPTFGSMTWPKAAKGVSPRQSIGRNKASEATADRSIVSKLSAIFFDFFTWSGVVDSCFQRVINVATSRSKQSASEWVNRYSPFAKYCCCIFL